MRFAIPFSRRRQSETNIEPTSGAGAGGAQRWSARGVSARRQFDAHRPIILPVVTLIGLFLLWEGYVRIFDIRSFLLPAPSSIFAELWSAREQLLGHTWITLAETLGGFGLSIVIGIPLAVVIVYSAVLRDALYPLLVVLNSVPKVAIAPLLLILLGTGVTSKVVIAFLVAFFPVIVSTTVGLAHTPSELLEMGRVYRAGKIRLFWKVRFPMALPHIFSGLKVAITLAVIGAVVGEFVGSNVGLGYQIIAATTYFNTALAFGAMIVLAAISVILFFLVVLAERLACPWYSSEGD